MQKNTGPPPSHHPSRSSATRLQTAADLASAALPNANTKKIGRFAGTAG